MSRLRSFPGIGTFALAASVLATPVSAQLTPAAPEEVGLSSERLARIAEVFGAYADEGRMAGAVGMVLRDGRVAYADVWGMRDVEAGDPMEVDDIFRIYSMTKPVTSVAVMMLWEEGHFFLDDPVGRYLPELADRPVARRPEATSEGEIPTEPARRPVTIRDLLRHTSGLTYGAFSNTSVDRIYRERGVLDQPTLEAMVEELGSIPLVHQPGTRWHYSVSTDVLGRLVEVVSGQSFDAFLVERIFGPLGMDDTGFHVPASKHDRLARMYGHADGAGTLAPGDTVSFREPTTFLSGGGGLVSTARDYARFAQMLLNGGELDGTRILSPKTVDLMTVNHLEEGMPTSFLDPGWGFGLGFTVKTELGPDGMPGSVGNYYWFGVGGTSFWVDPAEDLVGIFMIQIRPNRDVTFRQQFKRLVYQALVETE
ncbi:MAG: serine hydrolase domain-containing protein [Longimicrobiales bacterium]